MRGRGRGRGRLGPRLLAGTAGAMLLVGGLALLALPVAQAWWRQRGAEAAAQSWPAASDNLVAPLPGDASPPPETCTGSRPAGDYALVTFPSLERYGYRGVAGDGTWDLLNSRPMVHHRATPAPGQPGNVVIAFHREPAYLHIDELSAGDDVLVEDSSCHSFRYRISQRWQLSPRRVDQLSPTSGHDLTLVTCTPWYQDTERLVWRASLV